MHWECEDRDSTPTNTHLPDLAQLINQSIMESKGDTTSNVNADIFHPGNKEGLLRNSHSPSYDSNERSSTNMGVDREDDNGTAVVASLSTGIYIGGDEEDDMNGSVSSRGSKTRIPFFGRGSQTRSVSGNSTSERDDAISESSRGSYKRYSVWTKLAFQKDGWEADSFDEEYEEINIFLFLCNIICNSLKEAGMWFLRSVVSAVTTPKVLISFLLLFGVLLAGGILIVKSYADADEDDARENAITVANEVGLWFSTELDKALLPLFTLAQFVQELEIFHDLPSLVVDAPLQEGRDYNKNVTSVIDEYIFDKFDTIAARIKRDAKMEKVLVNMQLAPHAVVSLLYPLVNTEDFEPPTVLDNSGAVGHDLLSDPNRVSIAEATIPADSVVIAGPLTLIQGGTPVVREGLIARLAINNIGNNTIDLNGVNYPCWGFAVIIINWEAFKEKSGIYERFQRENLQFNMTRTDTILDESTGDYYKSVAIIANSTRSFTLTEGNSISVPLNTTNNEWVLQTGYEDGFRPDYEKWAYPLIVVSSLVTAFLFALILIAKEEHERLLYKMMPAKAIHKLKKNQTVIERYEMVTIFFSDIVGFTTMVGDMTPIDVMVMLNQLYTEFDKLVEKHDLYKVETIGDAYMVIGGAPNKCSGPEGAEKIAKFAIDAIQCVKDFRTESNGQIFIRVGLASGPVVAGVVGTSMPRYCLFGDTVNLASRMESTSRKMRIQCSTVTHRLLRDAPTCDFKFKERREKGELGVEVKGKGRQYTFWIEGVKPRGSDTDDKSSKFEDDLELMTMKDIDTCLPDELQDDDDDDVTANGSSDYTRKRSNGDDRDTA